MEWAYFATIKAVLSCFVLQALSSQEIEGFSEQDAENKLVLQPTPTMMEERVEKLQQSRV